MHRPGVSDQDRLATSCLVGTVARSGYALGPMRMRSLGALCFTISTVGVGTLGCASAAAPGATDVDGKAPTHPVAQPVATTAVAALSVSAAPVSASSTEPTAVASSAPPAAPVDAPPLPEGTKILIIGDSFAEALGVGLKAKEGEYHVKATLRGEKATFIPQWAGPNRGVPLMLKQVQPTLVVIALGGNELAMTDPSVRGPKVKQLVGFMGSIPCVWVSPPLWGNKDNGLLEIIRQNSSPCRYFDSNVLSPNLPRGSDKIHPNADGQKIWAKYVLDWLRKERDLKAPSFALSPRPPSE